MEDECNNKRKKPRKRAATTQEGADAFTASVTSSQTANNSSSVVSSLIEASTGTMDGARLGFQDVFAAGPPRDPLPEVREPEIHEGEANKRVLVVPMEGGPAELGRVMLVKTINPDFAYQPIGKPPKLLDHHGNGWGQIDFCVKLPRVRTKAADAAENGASILTFRYPERHEVERVAIKKVNKQVVREYLDRGGHEDPFKDISRLQEFGDNLHVLKCEEALEDGEFVYMITPYCREGSLMEAIPWGTGFPDHQARAIFKNILEILLYLEKHGIFHHDISPDNFLFLNGRLVLFDFAMSSRFPRLADGQRFLMKPQGIYGTFACQAPELFHNRTPFDGVGADLWSAAVTLYSLLTGQVLYRLPHPSDILFRYYILAEGLQPGLNEQTVEILEAAFQPENNRDQEDFMARAMANLNIHSDALVLLIKLLKFNPALRITLREACEAPWVQQQHNQN